MANISDYSDTVKVLRDAEWIDVEAAPFNIETGDLVQCSNGGWCELTVANTVIMRLADNGDAANRCYCGGGSSYYYPRR